MNTLPKVTAICCTYRRYECLQRVVNCFIHQTYPNKELIIFNTDTESPLIDGKCELTPYGIVVINNSHDTKTGELYTNVGAIRRDALIFAGGDYVVTWDDDDIFLPWFMQQAVDRLSETTIPSFKPQFSFFHSQQKIELARNTFEASVVASREKIIEYGYRLETGSEGLSWYTQMRDKKELNENDPKSIPSYCFNWSDGDIMKASHKQSGDINNPENFENHKKWSEDKIANRSIKIWDKEQMEKVFQPYINFISHNIERFQKELISHYVSPWLNS